MKKLTELKVGDTAIIAAYENEHYHLKLMEMGCVPGEQIAVEQIAITGDPICVYVAGYNLSLRKQEAETILVQ